ncbi:CpsD/CapB family tyrosine-protein kinase [Luteimonas saliphila]|uniref:CpsD/CapB family tyrosine-protein kinase n=1 Tax=Luteimonas saliphila TaxID=2804919 RepID=UPI00192E0738|nr:CpsD/CapB family tyrosine-protein kinase [Luteimonas saliphila]
MNVRRDALNPPTGDGAGSRSITRADGVLHPLTPRALEERKLIHRNDSVRAQADAFRGLRTRLLALGQERNFITLVAPVQQGCGGSFVARNLAAAFAFDETKTALLVDCDALHPAQDAALAVDVADGGIMDYLDGSVTDLSAIQYDTGLPRLKLIPSGTSRETTGEYFSSSRMRMMIDSLRGTHANRYLILDSPPVLNSPDARILSDLADLIVVVAGYGQATVDRIDEAAASFDPDKLAGVVFNNIY